MEELIVTLWIFLSFFILGAYAFLHMKIEEESKKIQNILNKRDREKEENKNE